MKRTILAAAAILISCLCHDTHACTGLYIGKKCSASGAVVIARCNDFHPTTIMPYVEITEAMSNVPGRQVHGINGFTWDLPATTFRYVSVPYPEISDYGVFASVASNEHGLALTATITGYYCQAAREADGDVPDGVAEETIPSILAPCCRTAREAIELMARVIDLKGSAEQNIIMVADQKEAWYMEMYSGHQYCAVKMPEDMVAVFGNEFMLDTVDPKSKDVICSKDLFKLPARKGFAVMDSNGRMNLRRTYQGDGRMYDFCHLRTWGGRRLLSPSTTGEYSHETYYPLFFRPDSKVSVADAMRVFRDRYEGTPFNPETSGNDEYRVIGDEAQEEVHIVEVYDNLPADMACVTWLSLSEAAHAPFIPLSNAITSCTPAYGLCAQEWGYTKGQAQHICKRVNAFCANNRKIYSGGVKAYWKLIEDHMLPEFQGILAKAAALHASDPAASAALLTEYSNAVQAECIADAERLFDDLVWHMMNFTQTNPYGSNFTTLVNRPSPMPVFDARVDVARVAQWKGWNCVTDAAEKSLTLTRAGKTIKLTAAGPHRRSLGTASFSETDGSVREDPAAASWFDGKVFLPLSVISILD